MAKRAHVRLPLQTPVVPHVLGACAAHSLSVSRPEGMGSQKPSRPLWLHFSHSPEHALSQQTPSVQNPEAHSFPVMHDCPCRRLQTPAAQVKPLAQWEGVEHEVRQSPEAASQVSGVQSIAPRSTQTP